MKKYLLLFAMIAFSGNAQSEAYVEVDYNKVDMDIVFSSDGSKINIDPSMITAEFGYMFTPYFGLAGNFGFGVSDDDLFSGGGITVSGEIDKMYSLKVIGQYPFNNNFSVFASAGFAKVNIKFNFAGFDNNDPLKYDDTGASFGIGFVINLAKAHALTFKYEILPDVDIEDGDKAEITTLGLGYRFQF